MCLFMTRVCLFLTGNIIHHTTDHRGDSSLRIRVKCRFILTAYIHHMWWKMIWGNQHYNYWSNLPKRSPAVSVVKSLGQWCVCAVCEPALRRPNRCWRQNRTGTCFCGGWGSRRGPERGAAGATSFPTLPQLSSYCQLNLKEAERQI